MDVKQRLWDKARYDAKAALFAAVMRHLRAQGAGREDSTPDQTNFKRYIRLAGKSRFLSRSVSITGIQTASCVMISGKGSDPKTGESKLPPRL